MKMSEKEGGREGGRKGGREGTYLHRVGQQTEAQGIGTTLRQTLGKIFLLGLLRPFDLLRGREGGREGRREGGVVVSDEWRKDSSPNTKKGKRPIETHRPTLPTLPPSLPPALSLDASLPSPIFLYSPPSLSPALPPSLPPSLPPFLPPSLPYLGRQVAFINLPVEIIQRAAPSDLGREGGREGGKEGRGRTRR